MTLGRYFFVEWEIDRYLVISRGDSVAEMREELRPRKAG